MAPAMQALDEIAAEVHRYGGWAIQSSPLPLPALVQIVSSGNCDFCGDAITPALVVAAIRAKDAAPLASLYKSWLESGLPLSKLGRGLNDGEGIYWKFLRGLPDGDKVINDAGFFNDAPNQRNGIMDITRAFAASKAGDAPNARTVCELLLAWRLGLPGLAFISASELEVMGKNFAGAAYTLNSGGKEGALFAARISAILKDRQKNDLANGRLVQVSSPKGGAMAVLSELPNGDFWFMGTNFGSTREVVELEAPKYKTARDILTGKDLGPANAGKFSLALDGGQARHVLLHMK